MTLQTEDDHGLGNALAWNETIIEAVTALKAGEDDYRLREAAEQAIQEMPLSVLVRDGWRTPGASSEGAEEYEILLSTGGPACRIYGKLDQHDQPETAYLQYQDWFTPWRDCQSSDALLVFASQFYFG